MPLTARRTTGRAPTMADIARISGVSTATVSRALTQPGLVSEATRNKVAKAVAETGYSVNTLARNLRKNETRTILVIVPDIANPFYSDVFEGIERVARENRYVVVIGDTEGDPVRETAYANMVSEKRADGLILLDGKLPVLTTGEDDEQPTDLPFVMACEYVDKPGVPFVRTNNADAAQLAIAHLVELGHTRIAHICGPLPRSISADRQTGYRAGLAEAGLTYDKKLVVEGDFGLESGGRAVEHFLALSKPPTAIFVSNDEMAMGAIQALHAKGLNVPNDMSIVGFDDIRFAGAYNPPLTTVSQPRYEIGRRATDMLMQLLSGDQPSQPQCELPSKLVVRGTTAPPPETQPT